MPQDLPQSDPDTQSAQEGAIAVLLGVVRVMVSSPAQVQIETQADATGVLLTLSVSPVDLDKVIGQGGRTARSLRTVLSAVGRKTGHRFMLDIKACNP